MIYNNYQAKLTSASGANRVVILSSGSTQIVSLESLIMIVNLPSKPLVNLQSLTTNPDESTYTQKVQLQMREKTAVLWSVIAEITISNKGIVYREDLIKYLSINNAFRVAPNYEIALQMVGSSLSANDSIEVLGSGAIFTQGLNDGGGVVQNFVTATYSVPSRDGWQNLAYEPNWQTAVNAPIQFYKDQIGRVHLRGFAQKINGTGDTPLVGILPAGYRVDQYGNFVLWGQAGSIVAGVDINGGVTAFSSGTNLVCFSGISFLAA